MERVNINEDTANVLVYERTFFKWMWKGYIITSGFGVVHEMEWSLKNNNWILLKDSYDEGPLAAGMSPGSGRSPDYTPPPVVDELSKESLIQTSSSNPIYTPLATYTYNRNAAASYADQHWSSYNEAYYKTQPNDCANFVSQSMHAGGAPYIGWRIHNSSSWWYDNNGTYPNQTNDDDWPLTWINVDYQYPFMLNHWGTEIPISDVNNGGLLKGDIVYYDWDGEYGVNHVAVVAYTYIDYSSVTYAVLVDSHTDDHYHYPWNYGYSSTIHHPIHISDYLSDNY